MKTILPVSVVLFLMGSVFVAQAEMKLPELKKQPTVQAVLDEHLDALNKCDWNRLVAQYPEDAQINLPGGTIAKGRAAIGELFAGFCKDTKDGGLKGIRFRCRHQHDDRGHHCNSMGGDRALLVGALQGL